MDFFACFGLRLTQTSKLLDTDGSLIRKVKLPVKAAELMLEKPGYVIAPVDGELQKTRRITALRADDELLASKIYLLAPLGRIRSKFSSVELKNIELACKCKNKLKKKGNSNSKSKSKVIPAMNHEEQSEDQDQIIKTNSDHQLSYFNGNKRWNPNLDTISEDFSASFRGQ